MKVGFVLLCQLYNNDDNESCEMKLTDEIRCLLGPLHQVGQKQRWWRCSNCNVTGSTTRNNSSSTSNGDGSGKRRRNDSRKNMTMNFAVPFVLINLICSSVAAVQSGSSPGEATASEEPSLSAVQSGGDGVAVQSTESSPVPTTEMMEMMMMMMSASDMDYYVQEEQPATLDSSGGKFRPKWSRRQEIMAQQKEQQQPTDFQEHFYLNAKFKEKDVPVPFTYSNFKRQQEQHHHQQQPSNFNAAAPYQGQQPSRGRSSWSAAGQEHAAVTREITIKQGRVKGIVRAMYRESGLRDVDQFLGLPYAESPVGNKRFMPPGAPPPWPGVRMANKLPPVCPQKLPKLDATTSSGGPGGSSSISKGRYNQLKRLFPYLKVESEDCLYLNLYVPRLDGKPIPKKYPVMVFIHGESYEWNSGNPYDGSVLASYGQVIVVTLNYRLGILGFMKPSVSEHTVSNFGLLDQMAALHWIKGNIAAFGGDNSAVTLMGHGTGAALVNLLMVSPVAKGLFQRAILMSGSALSDWAITTHALQSTLQVTQGLNCPLTDNQEEVLTCLRRKRYQEFVNIKTSSPEFSTSFGPVIDGLVIPNEPHVVMGQYSDLFSRYDLMFGVTELESYHQLSAAALEHGLLEREKNNLLRFYMQNRFEIRPDIALVATLKEYTDSYTDPKRAKAEEHRETLLEILSDARVVCPLIQAGVYHAKVNPRTYMYVFGHNSEAGDYPHLPLSVIGEELAYVFGAPLAEVGPFPRTFSSKERLLSEATMKYWSNFAKTGNPKAPWKDLFINLRPADWQKYDVDWSEYEPVNRTFLNLGLPPVIQQRYRDKYARFWNDRLPEELRNIKNLNLSPPYAEYYPMSHGEAPSEPASPQPPPPLYPPRGATSPFIDGKVNLFPNSAASYPRHHRPTEDPYKLLQLMGRNPGGFNVMAHPETDEEAIYGSTTERIIIVGPDIVVQKADTTLYVLIFMVVLLGLLLIAVLGVVLRRKYWRGAKADNRPRTEGGSNLATDKIASDLDESYIISTAMRNKKPPANNKYESMNFCRNLLQKYQRRRVKNQVYSQSSKADWMTTEQLAKYSPRFESKSSLSTMTTTRHSSFLSGGDRFNKSTEKVSVAIDATPQTRSDSVLRQEPIEITKAKANYLHNNNNERIIICQEIDDTPDMQNRASFSSYSSSSSSATISGASGLQQQSINPPPLNGQYEEMMELSLGDDEQVTSFIIAAADQEDINVTSRDESVERNPLSATETLSNIQRRKFPKVLPDYPEKNNKRHSLPPLPVGSSASVCAVPIDVHHNTTTTTTTNHPPVVAHTATLGRRGSNHSRYRRPPSRILIGASETQRATEPPQPEEPAITSNTLIVGPLVKSSAESIYTTLKRRVERVEGEGKGSFEPRKMMPLPSMDSTSNSSNDSIATVKQVQL